MDLVVFVLLSRTPSFKLTALKVPKPVFLTPDLNLSGNMCSVTPSELHAPDPPFPTIGETGVLSQLHVSSTCQPVQSAIERSSHVDPICVQISFRA